MDNEVIYDVECCVIKMAKLQKKKQLQLFSLGCVKWKTPPLNLKYAQLYSRFSLKIGLLCHMMMRYLSIYPVVSGGACLASRHKH